MDLVIYPLMSTRSKRAISRRRGRFGREYEYRPHGDFVRRLALHTGMTIEGVLKQIEQEREFILRSSEN